MPRAIKDVFNELYHMNELQKLRIQYEHVTVPPWFVLALQKLILTRRDSLREIDLQNDVHGEDMSLVVYLFIINSDEINAKILIFGHSDLKRSTG
jgi:hypothetical protein